MPYAKVKYSIKGKGGTMNTQKDVQVSSTSPTESEIMSKLKSLHPNAVKNGEDIILTEIIKTW